MTTLASAPGHADATDDAPALPRRLVLVDDDVDYSDYLTQFLCDKGIAARWYPDSDDLLCDARPFDSDFYIVDLVLPGVDGLALLRLLRKRTQAGILVVSGRMEGDIVDQVIAAGADMHLAKPVSFEQVLMAVAAVYRRSGAVPPQDAWRLDEAQGVLLAPGGARIELSATDVSVLVCLLQAGGNTVARDTLAQRLGRLPDDDANLLSATIYRLRRRIERATAAVAPLQAKSRLGYVFRAPLVRA